MKNSWKLLKLGVYVFALPLVATAAASAHQWMTVNSAIATAPAIPVAAVATAPARMTAIRNHTITLNEEGEVQGRVASINHKTKVPYGLSEVTVYFAQNGRVVQKAYTNEDGTFVAKGLKEGVYSFIAGNEVSFAVCGVSVIKGDGTDENYIEIASISPNVKVIKELIEESLPSSVRRELVTTSNDKANDVAGSNRVELDGDTLKGRIVSLVSEKLSAGTKAHLFKGSKKVSEFTISTDGTFEVAGVTPGVHDIVVLGKDGMAAVSFEAIGAVDENSKEAYTAVQDSVFANFIVALAPQCDGGCVSNACASCGGSDAVIYDSGPAGFIGDRLGGGIAGGGCCGGVGNFTNFGGCCGGGSVGRFGGLFGGRGRLLIPALAAGIAIPLAVGSESPEAPN